MRSCKLTCSQRLADPGASREYEQYQRRQIGVGVLAECVHPLKRERWFDLLFCLEPFDPDEGAELGLRGIIDDRLAWHDGLPVARRIGGLWVHRHRHLPDAAGLDVLEGRQREPAGSLLGAAVCGSVVRVRLFRREAVSQSRNDGKERMILGEILLRDPHGEHRKHLVRADIAERDFK